MSAAQPRPAIQGRSIPVVALDGPAGAGKSTVARRVAQALGFTLLDTGALYRVVAFASERAGVPWTDAEGVTEVGRALVAEGRLVIEPTDDSGMRVRLDGVDLGDALRTPAASMGASRVSAFPGVREALLDLQRDFARGGDSTGVVCEGRDIGTVVFPNAAVKIFLTASVDRRAERRHRELLDKGQQVDFAATRADVVQRDAQDEGRAIAPLRRADDAVLLDSSTLTLDETVARVLEIVSEKIGRTPKASA